MVMLGPEELSCPLEPTILGRISNCRDRSSGLAGRPAACRDELRRSRARAWHHARAYGQWPGPHRSPLELSMRILLTGSSGFIGRYLVRAYKERGDEVVGLDRAPDVDGLVDEFWHTDLLEPANYADRLGDIDLICHLAAAKGDWGISAEEYERDNVLASRALIDAAQAAGIKRWIYYSTVSSLGPSEIPLGEDNPRKPFEDYGGSKAASEELFEELLGDTDVQVTILRPSVVFGPGNPWNTNVYRLTDAIWRRRFAMVGDGHVIKSTSYVENLIAAHLFLSDHQVEAPHTGIDYVHYVDAPLDETRTIVARIYETLGRTGPHIRLPLWLASPLARLGDLTADLTGIDLPITSMRVDKFCRATAFAADKLRALGFEQPVTNEEALRTTVNWYLDTHVR